MADLEALIGGFTAAGFVRNPTPLDRLDRLSAQTGLDLWIKRDDLTGLGLGGNKIRQLDYYMGDALSRGADTVLITGAVQSNYVRAAAACAAKLGMGAVLQLEDRVADMGALYESSGNVLLGQILGAKHIRYPEGEDEAGADRALRRHADTLKAQGRTPYVIPLGLQNPPMGALGYMRAAQEILAAPKRFDAVVVASGSGITHAGLLAGLRVLGCDIPVYGICVRRSADAQKDRLATIAALLGEMLEAPAPFGVDDLHFWDGALAPGYGQLGDHARAALLMMARAEGVLLDPVYTAKSFAGVLGLVRDGVLRASQRVLFIHTGGQPALFGYGADGIGL